MLTLCPHSAEGGEATFTVRGFWLFRTLEGQSNWPNEDLFKTLSASAWMSVS